jgi:hypothetical protein
MAQVPWPSAGTSVPFGNVIDGIGSFCMGFFLQRRASLRWTLQHFELLHDFILKSMPI